MGPIGPRVALGCAAISGALLFLGFAGYDVLPLAFIATAPLLVALDGRHGWAAFGLGWITGTVAMAGGFSWMVGMLRTFSGLPAVVCLVLAALLWIGQGLQFGLLAWLITRADAARIPRLLSVPLFGAGLELAFPVLFPYFVGASLHRIPLLFQTADLGGVMLLSAALLLGHAALAEVWRRGGGWRHRVTPVLAPLVFWSLAVPYGVWRLAAVDAANGVAPSLRVGIIQENLGLAAKRVDPRDSLRRHLAVSRQLEQRGVDWIVWSESAIGQRLPPSLAQVRDVFPGWDLRTPVLFGALSARGDPDNPRVYNTAFMTGASGKIAGTYDKMYLMAFGEYLPLGHWFPRLYEWSPHSVRLTAGETMRALPIPGGTVMPLICYEDLLPGFVRRSQNQISANLLTVILNDAWFGNSAEPGIHHALATMRAVEQRRDLVRAANSGVSSIIDAGGRTIVESAVFSRQTVTGIVHLRRERTVYARLGDWPGVLGLTLALLVMLVPRWRIARAPRRD